MDTPGSVWGTMSGLNLTTVGSRSTTFEFWVKPGGTEETFVCINGNPDPEIDLDMVAWTIGLDAENHMIVANGGGHIDLSRNHLGNLAPCCACSPSQWIRQLLHRRRNRSDRTCLQPRLACSPIHHAWPSIGQYRDIGPVLHRQTR